MNQPPDYYLKLYYSRDSIHSRLNQMRINSVLRYIPKHTSVLDCGCGSVLMSLLLDHNKVTGVDNDKAIIEKAKGIGIGEYICADLRTMKLDRNFDVVLCSHTLEHFRREERMKVISTLDGHTKVGGLLMVFVPSLFFMRFIEKPFMFMRSFWNNLSYDDEDIHEKIHLVKETAILFDRYEIVKMGHNTFFTTEYMILRKMEG